MRAQRQAALRQMRTVGPSQEHDLQFLTVAIHLDRRNRRSDV